MPHSSHRGRLGFNMCRASWSHSLLAELWNLCRQYLMMDFWITYNLELQTKIFILQAIAIQIKNKMCDTILCTPHVLIFVFLQLQMPKCKCHLSLSLNTHIHAHCSRGFHLCTKIEIESLTPSGKRAVWNYKVPTTETWTGWKGWKQL